MGERVSRNEDWVNTVREFTESVPKITRSPRVVPPALHGLVAFFSSSSWKVESSIRTSCKILPPKIERRCRAGAEVPIYKKPLDLLQEMIDLAEPGSKQSEAADLAHRQLFMSLVLVHTPARQAANTLFDLCAHPEFFDILRAEVVADVVDDPARWHKQSLDKLRKMDSFFKETQRVNPPGLRE